MQELQKQVDRVSTDIPKLVESQSQQVSQQLNRITQDVQQEKKERFTREGILLKQIQDYEQSINEAIEQERSQTQTKLEHLRDMLETNESGRVQADTRFASLIEQDLTMLKHQLQMEMEQRQAEDDAIVDAMNRYTTKLQATLTAITSDE
jgi:ATP-dependent Clp protease ATP-binding subunit ClpA